MTPALSFRAAALCAALATAAAGAQAATPVLSSIAGNLVAHYSFENPVAGNAAQETDLGLSGTTLSLVNGGAAMRTADGAWAGSATSIQTQQVAGANNDWKAGVHNRPGVSTLDAFNGVAGITVMGFVKPTGSNPSPNTNTTNNPNDFFNAVGLFGVLRGDSNGHDVRALLEVIDVGGTLRLVALGRRVDSAGSYTFAASANWQDLIPMNEWTHLAATFDFGAGTMALYRNGEAVAGFYTSSSNPWQVTAGTDLTSATTPSGIKIGGSYPQNTSEQNPFNGRFDELMFLDRALTADEVAGQYGLLAAAVPEPGSALMLALGLGGLGAVRRLRRRG